MATLSEYLANFMAGPHVIHVGTRDAELRPAHHMAFGAVAAADRQHLTIVVPEHLARRLRENLAHNGQVAVSLGPFGAHETYQIKGTAVEVRPAGAEDLANVDRYVQGMIEVSQGEPGFADLVPRLVTRPCVAVTLRVDAVFDQTPGPGAGKQME